MKFRRIQLLILVVSLLFLLPVAAGDNVPLDPLPGPLAAWQTVEFAPEFTPAGNPYDPDSTRLDAVITTPSGAVSVPGFWYQPHTRAVEEGRGYPDYPEMWTLPGMDYTQAHTYLAGIATIISPAKTIAVTAEKFYNSFHKPFYVGEYGVTWRFQNGMGPVPPRYETRGVVGDNVWHSRYSDDMVVGTDPREGSLLGLEVGFGVH